MSQPDKSETKPSRRPIPKLIQSEAERQAVYRLRERVSAADNEVAGPSGAEPEDEGADIFAVEVEGELIASIRVCRGGVAEFPAAWTQLFQLDALGETIPRERVCVSDRLVIHPDWRSSRALGLLLAMAYRTAREHGIWIEYTHCAPALISLYEQLGYRRYAPAFVDEVRGNRVPMLMLTEDLRHLQVVRSPLLQLSRAYRSSKKRPNEQAEAESADRTARDWFHQTFPEHAKYINRRALRGSSFWKVLGAKLSSELPGEAIPLFRGLDDKQIQSFLETGAMMSFEAGQTVLRPGDRGEEMFIVLSGLAEVFAHRGDEKLSINLMGRGELFGEIGLLGEHERSAEVVARSDLELLVLSGHSLRRSMKSHPKLMCTVLYNLSMILANRLRLSTENWMESVESEES